jgi:hypothetical protein
VGPRGARFDDVAFGPDGSLWLSVSPELVLDARPFALVGGKKRSPLPGVKGFACIVHLRLDQGGQPLAHQSFCLPEGETGQGSLDQTSGFRSFGTSAGVYIQGRYLSILPAGAHPLVLEGKTDEWNYALLPLSGRDRLPSFRSGGLQAMHATKRSVCAAFDFTGSAGRPVSCGPRSIPANATIVACAPVVPGAPTTPASPARGQEQRP